MGNSIFIYGSCVTRDPFASVPNDYTLTGYICRSSFASAFANEPFDLGLSQLDPEGVLVSKFQRRMVHSDLKKNAISRISSLGSTDTIVIDLVDERFPLMFKKGTLATYSNEVQRLQPMERFKDISLIKADTTQHYEIWLEGLRRFAKIVQNQGTKIILNKVKFADKDRLGVNFPANFVKKHNKRLHKMYEAIQSEMDCMTIEYDSPFISDPEHKWRRSAFHYIEEVNVEFISKLNDIFKAMSR